MGNKADSGSDSDLELDWGSRDPRSHADASSGASPSSPEAEVPETALAGKGAPGDPRYMSTELRYAMAAVLSSPVLRMRQFRETMEIILGWEGLNQYSISGEDGRNSVFMGETGAGWAAQLKRNFWPFHRPRMECMTPTGLQALSVEFPWHFFLARADLLSWDGRPMGGIVQRLSFPGRRLDIVSPSGGVLATVEGPLFKPWTFRVFQRGEEVAVIRKHWSGFLQETFSDADNFSVEFRPSCTDARFRQLVLATAMLVDLTYFDNRRSGSVFTALWRLWA